MTLLTNYVGPTPDQLLEIQKNPKYVLQLLVTAGCKCLYNKLLTERCRMCEYPNEHGIIGKTWRDSDYEILRYA